MAKKAVSGSPSQQPFNYSLPGVSSKTLTEWQSLVATVALRFNQDYQGEHPQLPEEVEAMPIFQDWVSKSLQSKLTSPFWELAKPSKGQRCLDIGCGISFLIYPWREWDAFFYGVDISTQARDILNMRGPQLNSKLFKGVTLTSAHELTYEAAQFDLAIATGVSCYYPMEYWAAVLPLVKQVLKPGGQFVFDVVNAELPLAENWAILETYLGAEVFLEPLADWQQLIKAKGGRVKKTRSGEIFELFQVQF
jgi:SAM-dependent methyltransferase